MKNLIFSLAMIFSVNGLAQNAVNGPTDGKNITGFKLIKIELGSIYEKLGLKEGDIIKKIDGEAVTTPTVAQSLFSKIKKSDKTEIVIERNGKEEILRYTLK